jgi:hypothetical protein
MASNKKISQDSDYDSFYFICSQYNIPILFGVPLKTKLSKDKPKVSVGLSTWISLFISNPSKKCIIDFNDFNKKIARGLLKEDSKNIMIIDGIKYVTDEYLSKVFSEIKNNPEVLNFQIDMGIKVEYDDNCRKAYEIIKFLRANNLLYILTHNLKEINEFEIILHRYNICILINNSNKDTYDEVINVITKSILTYDIKEKWRYISELYSVYTIDQTPSLSKMLTNLLSQYKDHIAKLNTNILPSIQLGLNMVDNIKKEEDEKIKEMEEGICRYDNEYVKIKDENEKSIRDLKREMEDLKSKCIQLSLENDNLKITRLSEMERENRRLEEINKNLKGQLEENIKLLDSYKTTTNDMNKRCDLLIEDIDSLKKKLESFENIFNTYDKNKLVIDEKYKSSFGDEKKFILSLTGLLKIRKNKLKTLKVNDIMIRLNLFFKLEIDINNLLNSFKLLMGDPINEEFVGYTMK